MLSEAAPALIELNDVVKRFPGVAALDHVGLRVRVGTIHALLGENGAGKSTLINILSGVLRPDHGEFLLRGKRVMPADAKAARRLGIAAVHQEADLFSDLSVAENIAIEHGWPARGGLVHWPALRRATCSALGKLDRELDPDSLARTLTAAERQLVGIAAALAQDASILILDEPTSSLSANETETLFDHLRAFRAAGGAILYVSHRLEETFQLADEATVLRDGKRVWTGPLIGVSADQLIAWMVGRTPMKTLSRRSASLPGPVRLTCEGLTATDGSFQDVSLVVRAGEVLGIYGLIGAGRSEWAQAVFGLLPVASGQTLVDGKPWVCSAPGDAVRHGLAYLPEDRLRLGLCSGLSVKANAVLAALRRLSFGPFVSKQSEVREAGRLVNDLAIRLRTLLQPAGTLSGGNQQKVIVGRCLACQPQTLILDEPTRGVDVAAKGEIHALLHRLADTGRAVVLISSDLPEVLGQSDRVAVFREGRVADIFDPQTATAEQVARVALPIANKQASSAGEAPPSPSMAFLLREAGLFAAAFLLAAFLGWRTNGFLQAGTLRDVGESTGLLALCGLGAGVVILGGGIDISFGAIMALGAATAGYLMQNGHSPWLAVTAGLATATFAGLLNAALTLVGRVHPIVITLGTMSLYRGLVLLLISGEAIHDVPTSFHDLCLAAPLGIPVTAWLAVASLALAWFLLGWTVSGRQLYALGNNPKAAERAGIRRSRVWLATFTIEGFLAGVAGLVALGTAAHLQSNDFDEKTLEAIGVAVIGGIAITGGRGSVWGICGAALLFRILEKGWMLLHISGYWQRTIVGGLLLLAIVGDRLWRGKRT
jgi:ribose transport system ATP-binding protein/rhamnose transport system ATP-binding protein